MDCGFIVKGFEEVEVVERSGLLSSWFRAKEEDLWLGRLGFISKSSWSGVLSATVLVLLGRKGNNINCPPKCY